MKISFSNSLLVTPLLMFGQDLIFRKPPNEPPCFHHDFPFPKLIILHFFLNKHLMTILGFVTVVFFSTGQAPLDFVLVCFLVEQLIINHHDSRKIVDIIKMDCFCFSGTFYTCISPAVFKCLITLRTCWYQRSLPQKYKSCTYSRSGKIHGKFYRLISDVSIDNFWKQTHFPFS